MGKNRDVTSLAVSPDSMYIAVGVRVKEAPCIFLMKIQDGNFLFNTLIGHSDTIWSLKFFPDSKALVSGSKDRTIHYYSMDEFEKTMNESRQARQVSSPGNKKGTPRLSLQSSKSWTTHFQAKASQAPEMNRGDESSSHVRCLAIKDDGQAMAAGCTNGKTLVFEMRPESRHADGTKGGSWVKKARLKHAPNNWVDAVAFLKEDYLVTASRDRKVVIWNWKLLKDIYVLHHYPEPPTDDLSSIKPEKKWRIGALCTLSHKEDKSTDISCGIWNNYDEHRLLMWTIKDSELNTANNKKPSKPSLKNSVSILHPSTLRQGAGQATEL